MWFSAIVFTVASRPPASENDAARGSPIQATPSANDADEEQGEREARPGGRERVGSATSSARASAATLLIGLLSAEAPAIAVCSRLRGPDPVTLGQQASDGTGDVWPVAARYSATVLGRGPGKPSMNVDWFDELR